MKKYIVHYTSTEMGLTPPLETMGTPKEPVYEAAFEEIDEARAFYYVELAAAATRGDITRYEDLDFSPTEREDAQHCSCLELARIVYDEDGEEQDIEEITTEPFWV